MRTFRRIALLLAALPLLLFVPPGGVPAAYAAVPTANQTNLTFTSKAGVTSRYHLYGAGVTEPAGLLLQFHGDGAYEFRNPTSTYSLGGSKGIVAQALARNLITVPVLSPDTTGAVTWWEAGSRNADYVQDLLLDLRGRYNIRADRIWLVGYSGGAQFITQYFLPKYSSSIAGGGAVIFGGGDRPAVTSQPLSATFRANFPMHWYTGANDTGWDDDGFNALAAAKAGEAWYANNGISTSHEWPAGVSHALDGTFGTVVARQLDAHPGTSPTDVTPPDPEPEATPTTPGTLPWAVTVTPRRTSVNVRMQVPDEGRTVLTVTASNGRTWTRSTTATGQVDLSVGSLRAGRTYTFRVTHSGDQVASGSFTTRS